MEVRTIPFFRRTGNNPIVRGPDEVSVSAMKDPLEITVENRGGLDGTFSVILERLDQTGTVQRTLQPGLLDIDEGPNPIIAGDKVVYSFKTDPSAGDFTPYSILANVYDDNGEYRCTWAVLIMP